MSTGGGHGAGFGCLRIGLELGLDFSEGDGRNDSFHFLKSCKYDTECDAIRGRKK